MTWKCAVAVAAMATMFAPAVAQADSSISAVEGARAKDRQGSYLSPQDRDNLRRYGGNDDYGPSYGYGGYGYDGGYYADGYGYGPGVHVYIGPGY